VRGVSVDLHTHTVYSDGTTTPAHNVALARAAGLRGLAITDHDTLAGWDEAAEACTDAGLEFVPGLELSTEEQGVSVHVLGYWVNPDDPALRAECERLRGERAGRARRILGRLAELGVSIDEAAVLARAAGAPVGRPHVAHALVDAGVVPDIETAFTRYLADGGPAWVPKHALSPEDGVRLIRGAGGVAVLAHPGTGPIDAVGMSVLVERLAAVGLAAVEADHAGHDPDVAAFWRTVARQHGLLVTGSSDYHGDRKGVVLGAATTPLSTVVALRRQAVTDRSGGGAPVAARPAAMNGGDMPW
jgi:3',5'-nucleoside bisphosphate phosphatase